jgi:hypothetical protein
VAVSISAPTPTSPVATAGGPALARDDGGTNLPSAQDVENFVKGKATNVTIKVPDLFLFLLTKLQVEPELLRETASAYTDQEKLLIVGDCTRYNTYDSDITSTRSNSCIYTILVCWPMTPLSIRGTKR